MERLTARKTAIVLFQKDGQYTPPISMNGEQVRKVLERLAELEDAIEQGKLVEVVRCGECKYRSKYGECENALGEPEVFLSDYCSHGEPRGNVCASKDCVYQTGKPCIASEVCGGYEGAEDSFLMQRFMRLE